MKTNRWKRLFFLLLGMNVAFWILIFIIIGLPVKDVKVQPTKMGEYVPFHIQTNKSDLNKVINHYLEKQNGKGPIQYEVVLKDQVELYGDLPLFSDNVQMKLTFEPIPLENGNLILQQKEISIGQLHLPVSYVMKFIRDRYDLPEWVIIQPNKKNIVVDLQKMKLKGDVKVKLDRFDLANDSIQFSLLIPTEK